MNTCKPLWKMQFKKKHKYNEYTWITTGFKS